MHELRTAFGGVLAAILAIGLAACGGDGGDSGSATAPVKKDATPAEVMKTYAAALGSGAVEEAMALVDESAAVSPASVTVMEALPIREPLLTSNEELSGDVESITQQFDVGGEPWAVDFIKTSDGWKLRTPAFLARNLTLGETASAPFTPTFLQANGAEMVTASGEAFPITEWVATSTTGESILPGRASWAGDAVWQANEWPIPGSLRETDRGIEFSVSIEPSEPNKLVDALAAPLLADARAFNGPAPYISGTAVWASDEGYCGGDLTVLGSYLSGSEVQIGCPTVLDVTSPNGSTAQIEHDFPYTLSSDGTLTPIAG